MLTLRHLPTGRTALVTGGSRGIGAATALRLAREGADVALTYVNGKDAAEDVVRDVEALGATGGGAAGGSPPTPTRRPGVVERAAQSLGGRLDVLVNNVGVAACSARWRGLSLADVDRLLAVNVRGVFLTRRRPRPTWPRAAGSSRSAPA